MATLLQSILLSAAFALSEPIMAGESGPAPAGTEALAPAETDSTPQSASKSRRRKITVRLDDAGNPITNSIESVPVGRRVVPAGAQATSAEPPDSADRIPAYDSQVVPPPPDAARAPRPREIVPVRLTRPFPRPAPGEIDFAPRLIPCYKPLYFEDANLERYGCIRGGCLQPVVSGVHFFGSVGLAPLKMLGVGPCQTVCPLPDAAEGHCLRPSRNLFGPTPCFDRLLLRSE